MSEQVESWNSEEKRDAARISLAEEFEGSQWRTSPAFGGLVVGRLGYMSIEMNETPNGKWFGTGRPNDRKPPEVKAFDIFGTGDTPADVVRALQAQL